MVKKVKKVVKVRRIEDTVSFVFAIIFLALFFVILVLLNFGFFQKTDELVNSYFSTSSNQLLISFFLFISFLFDPLSIIALSLVLFLILFLNGRKKDSLFFLVAPILGGILIFFFKEIIRRARPDNIYEFGFSFPSGHATTSIILFCSLVYFSFRYMKGNFKYVVSFFSLALLLTVIFSRIYLGVHWFSDALGGVFLGAFVFLLTVYFFEKVK